jgi:glycosyltransferase involved in cell wall biosynthesis
MLGRPGWLSALAIGESEKQVARVIVHLTASTFYGGPERQMLGLAQSLPAEYRTVFLSFGEGGRCQAFLRKAMEAGCEALALEHDTPHLLVARRDLVQHLGRLQADILLCHGYKADLVGRKAARRAGIPVVAVSRGWTWESLKVRLYEALDRLVLRSMDRVVCVSEAQAARVRRAGTPSARVLVIHNAVRAERFGKPDPGYKQKLEALFPDLPAGSSSRIILAAGRLSPEKGFSVLLEAARQLVVGDPSIRFVLFGEGKLRNALERQAAAWGLTSRLVLPGFRADLDRFLPVADVVVQSSFTEGLPNLVLEACAAGVPVVATAVGGTPEILEDGVSGYLVAPGDPATLATRIQELLSSEQQCQTMGDRGRRRILEQFSFGRQSLEYQRLFDDLLSPLSACFTDSMACHPEAPAKISGRSAMPPAAF